MRFPLSLASRTLALAILAVFMGSCGVVSRQAPVASTGSASLVDGNQLPEPGRRDLVAGNRPYLIGPFDKLEVDVLGIEGLEKREVSADAAGNISFPIAGVIDASGLTPRELETTIAQRLRAGHIRDPQVTVNLKELVGHSVTVDGQVKQPGVYPILGKMTLIKAVATARGVDEFAKLNDVVVLRTVGAQQYAGLYNLEAIRRGNYPDPEIFPNDTVVVGESKSRRLFRDLLQAAPLLSTPLIIAFQ